MIVGLLFVVIILHIILYICIYKISKEKKEIKLECPDKNLDLPLQALGRSFEQLSYQISQDQNTLKRVVDDMPRKVLSTIQGSGNNIKGNLGELISYMKLHAAYDKVIPIGDVVDFIGIKYPQEGQEGTIDFVEVKTGNARLSKDQLKVQKLIKEKKIKFCKLHVDLEEGSQSEDES